MRRLLQIIRFVRIGLKARDVQDFLWGGAPGHRETSETWAGYVGAIQKRVDRLNAVDPARTPAWRVEARKRMLQTAAVAVAMMEWLDAGGCPGAPPRDPGGIR